MPELVAMAVLHGDPAHVIVAQDLETLQWRIALEIVARTDADAMPPDVADQIRRDLLAERWGAAVVGWLELFGEKLDVYETWAAYGPADVELAPVELQFTPLFQGPQ